MKPVGNFTLPSNTGTIGTGSPCAYRFRGGPVPFATILRYRKYAAKGHFHSVGERYEHIFQAILWKLAGQSGEEIYRASGLSPRHLRERIDDAWSFIFAGSLANLGAAFTPRVRITRTRLVRVT